MTEMRCDRIEIRSSSQLVKLGSEEFEISIRLTNGSQYRWETFLNNGVQGDSPEEIAEFFEEIARTIRTVTNVD